MQIREIQDRLEKLHASSADIEGVALVNQDGFIIACVLPDPLDEERVASVTAAFQGMAERCSQEMEKGHSLQTLLKTDGGYVVITRAGPDAYLSLVSGPHAKPGMLLLEDEGQRAGEAVLEVLVLECHRCGQDQREDPGDQERRGYGSQRMSDPALHRFT